MNNPATYLWRNIEMNAVRDYCSQLKEPIYDMGCGDGSIAKQLFKNKLVVGVDKIGNVDIQADMTELPIEDGKIQSVFCNSVLEHIQGVPFAIMEIGRILKPGGMFVFTVPTDLLSYNILFPFAAPINAKLHHKNLFNHQQWKNLLFTAGLTIVEHKRYLNETNTRRWCNALIGSTFGIQYDQKKLDKWIGEDTNEVICSCIAVLATKV